MRPFRVFNGVDRIDVEWTTLGQRWRLPSRTLLIASLAAGVGISVATTPWAGAPLAGIAAVVVVFGNWKLNQMDPEGALRETTQLGLLWRTARHPYVTNTGRR